MGLGLLVWCCGVVVRLSGIVSCGMWVSGNVEGVGVVERIYFIL